MTAPCIQTLDGISVTSDVMLYATHHQNDIIHHQKKKKKKIRSFTNIFRIDDLRTDCHTALLIHTPPYVRRGTTIARRPRAFAFERSRRCDVRPFSVSLFISLVIGDVILMMCFGRPGDDEVKETTRTQMDIFAKQVTSPSYHDIIITITIIGSSYTCVGVSRITG